MKVDPYCNPRCGETIIIIIIEKKKRLTFSFSGHPEMGFVFEREMKFPVELIKSFFPSSFFLLNCSKYLDIQFDSARAAVFFPD